MVAPIWAECSLMMPKTHAITDLTTLYMPTKKSHTPLIFLGSRTTIVNQWMAPATRWMMASMVVAQSVPPVMPLNSSTKRVPISERAAISILIPGIWATLSMTSTALLPKLKILVATSSMNWPNFLNQPASLADSSNCFTQAILSARPGVIMSPISILIFSIRSRKLVNEPARVPIIVFMPLAKWDPMNESIAFLRAARSSVVVTATLPLVLPSWAPAASRAARVIPYCLSPRIIPVVPAR